MKWNIDTKRWEKEYTPLLKSQVSDEDGDTDIFYFQVFYTIILTAHCYVTKEIM